MIVIGGGAVGEHCAGALAEGGKRVAIVERELVGGECSYWACIPSKTLLRPGEAVRAAREAAASAEVEVDAVLAWRDFMVSDCSGVRKGYLMPKLFHYRSSGERVRSFLPSQESRTTGASPQAAASIRPDVRSAIAWSTGIPRLIASRLARSPSTRVNGVRTPAASQIDRLMTFSFLDEFGKRSVVRSQ